jgi:type I restriction enzyme, S subunit
MDYLDKDFSRLPADWSIRPLREVAEIHNKRRAPLNGHQREKKKGRYPYCGANGIVDWIDEYRFDGEFVLVAEDGGYWGKNEASSYVMRGKFWVNNHAHVIREREGISNNAFLSCLLNFMDISPLIGGDARGKLTKSILERLPLVTPPVAEQWKIAAILRSVQDAMEQEENLVALTGELKKALLKKLFTDGLRHEPQKQTELGPIPKSWEFVQLGSIAELINGFAFKSEDYVPEGVLNFRVVNIRDQGVIDVLNNIEFLPRSFMDTYKQYLLSEGDILIVMVGATRGKLAFIPKAILPALMNQNMWRIVPISQTEIHRRYLYHFLTTAVPKFVCEFSESARGFFKKSDFRSIKIPKPSFDEQKEIAEAIDSIEQKISLHRCKQAALNALFRTLLYGLMTARIRVRDVALSELPSAA